MIESSLQNSLPYILLQMVCARYCTSYPKWLCYMMSFCSRTFYSLPSSFVINVVTTPSDVTDVTVWQITSNPNPRVLKIEKMKNKSKRNKNEKENKKKQSLLSAVLILIDILNHPSWTTFSRNPTHVNDCSRVIIYINIYLFSLHFVFHKDIYNHRDISLVLFFNNKSVFYLIKIYSDSSQTALKYLKDSEVNFWNLLIMTDNFNIRDSL